MLKAVYQFFEISPRPTDYEGDAVVDLSESHMKGRHHPEVSSTRAAESPVEVFMFTFRFRSNNLTGGQDDIHGQYMVAHQAKQA
jgi:hypothetical protein